MIPKSHGWRKTAVASLVFALFGLPASSAFALALGRITVQSALGEPLRAEIDIPEINADEAGSLKPTIAAPGAFRAAGLEYNPALAGIQITLQRRADGRAYIRLVSDRAVSEPFVDLIVQASWASGRIVRDYTILLDPPTLRARTPAAPIAPQVAATPVAPARVTPAPVAPAAAATAPAAPARVAAAPARQAQNRRVSVQRGDTASEIARANKPAEVSLDQMLVALLRANQNAFINGNLNLLKAGAVLTMPSDEQANATSEADASRTVIAHSRDFNDFRNKLASNAPAQKVESADRSAGGAIKAQVEDKRSTTAVPDKLTLSKGTADAKAAEEKLAQAKAAEDAAKRTAELARNVKDLSNISAASAASGTATPLAAPAPAASAPAEPAAPLTITAATPLPAVSAVAEITPAASAVPAPAPAAVAAPAPAAEPGMLDALLDNPLAPLGGGLLIALLAGLGFYKVRQRRDATEVDSAFLESRLQPDSFFGASGGQRVNTNDGAVTGSSMVYSPSQLDAADDVDPVAEADVYLAYGRDLQAEEILKEALRTHPGRIAVHQKLLNIYAKRRDTQAYEGMAKETFRLAGGDSPEWARICEQGQGIDPANPLYRPGSNPAAEVSTLATSPMGVMAAGSMATQKIDRSAEPVEAQQSASVDLDLDLDLDFSLDEEPVSAIEEVRPSQLEPTVAMPSVESQPADLDVDFGVSTESMTVRQPNIEQPVELALPDIDSSDDTVALGNVDSDDFRQQAAVSFGSTSPSPLSLTDEDATVTPAGSGNAGAGFDRTVQSELTASQTPFKPPSEPEGGMLEFDLGTLSLDLDAGEPGSEQMTSEPEDPLGTKLALAEEFVSIGDDDGARALIEEVISEATGDLKAKAQRALASLG